MLKILSSGVNADSDINYMPVIKLLACLGVGAYLTFNENPIFSNTLKSNQNMLHPQFLPQSLNF